MPTGYTADIKVDTTFRVFALKCARAFGALIIMRDDPLDAPIPEAFQSSSYEADRVKACKARALELASMTLEQAEVLASAEYEAEIATREKSLAAERAQEANYRRMLAEAEAWKPPTCDHEPLREFMIQQLTESIRFDCGMAFFYAERPVVKLDAATWLARAKGRSAEALTQAEEYLRDEEERTRGRNEWVKALRESL